MAQQTDTPQLVIVATRDVIISGVSGVPAEALPVTVSTSG